MASPLDPPSPYGYASNGNISRLIMMGGEERARAAERAGEIWANSIGNIGNIAAGAVQQSQEIKQEQKKQAQMAKRDAAAVDFVSNWKGDDPKELFAGLSKIGGLEYAAKFAPVAASLHSKPTEDAKTELQGVYVAGKGIAGMSPEMAKAAWPGFVGRYGDTLVKKGLITPEQLQGDWTPEHQQAMESYLKPLGAVLGIKEGDDSDTVVVGNVLVNRKTGQEVYKPEAKPEKPGAVQHVDLGDRVEIQDAQGNVLRTERKGAAPKAAGAAEAEGDFGQYVRTSPTAGRTYMSAGDFSTPKDKQSASNYAKTHGIPYIDKDNGVALQEITNAASDLRDAYAAAKDLFPESKLGTVGAQAKEFMQVGSGPALKAYEDTVADVAIRLGRATSGGKGLRFSKDLIAKMQQAVPSPVKDVKATADDKMKRLDTYLKNVEDAIFPGASTGGSKGPDVMHSQAEVDALPAGTVFIDASDGKKYKKGS